MKTLTLLVSAATLAFTSTPAGAQSTHANPAPHGAPGKTDPAPGKTANAGGNATHDTAAGASAQAVPPATAATAKGNASVSAAAAKDHEPNPNASANSNAVQAILQKFDASRDQLITERQALIDKLAAAKTETDRDAALAELRDEQKSMQDVQRSTAKEIRTELQNLRRQRAGGG